MPVANLWSVPRTPILASSATEWQPNSNIGGLVNCRQLDGMGGGSMLRTMGRAVSGVGVKDVLSATAGVRPGKPALIDSARLSSSSPQLLASSGVSTGERDGSFSGGTERLVFGPVPSKEEAEEAVSALQRIFPVSFSQFIEDGLSSLEKDGRPSARGSRQCEVWGGFDVRSLTLACKEAVSGMHQVSSLEKDVSDKMPSSTKMMHQVSSTELELEWIEPTAQLHSSESSQLQGQNRVIDAFRLLQLNPSVQRAVVSLSSDKAVWDAVMKNAVIQELKESFYAAGSSKPQSHGGPDIATRILSWILENSKAKVIEFINKITKLVNELLHSRAEDKNMEILDDVLRSSFMLSVMVFIVVIVSRSYRA